MAYKGKHIVITGRTGFIGSAVIKALEKLGADVHEIAGDIRTTPEIEKIGYTTDYVFHFGSPSSQILFQRNPAYCIDATINGFLRISKRCHDYGVKLIYPSTGLLSQGKMNSYAMAKKMCEDIHLGMNLDAMGLRIFAGYGQSEGHKRDYASVPYLFTRNAVEGKEITIWGDGKQTRDFIYIDDLVRAILILAEQANEKIIDVGSGEPVSFNEIVTIILSQGLMLNKTYVEEPQGYVRETMANTNALVKYGCLPETSIREGVKKIINSLV